MIVLQTGEHSWYRTADISPDVFWKSLAADMSSLGKTTVSSPGETQLILPPLVKRRITMLYPDGRPAANASITLSIYVWDTNHSGFHVGLPLGVFRTDKAGMIEAMAPLVPLYLDGIRYYEPGGSSPAGVAYSSNFGLKTGAEQNLVLKKKWMLTDDDSLIDDYKLRVLTPSGQPRKNVDVWGNWLTNTCGGGDRIGQTDAAGVAQMIWTRASRVWN